jgi:phosphate transport system permease protein
VSTTAEFPRVIGPAPKRQPITVGNLRTPEDRLFRGTVRTIGYGTVVLLILIGFFLLIHGLPALRLRGIKFFTTGGFQTLGKHPAFGVLDSLYGTCVVAIIALIVGVPIALTTAIFLSEYAPAWSKRTLIALVDLAAAIPSVIYGLWGFFELMPNVVGISNWMSAHLGFIPLFKIVHPPANASLFIAGLLVGFMIVPIVASVSREVFSLAPPGEKEAALALGATRWQMIRSVVIPFGRGGVIGAVMLGMGRALEETIAVSIILGESFVISDHILQHGGSTIASLIAISFGSGGKLGLEDLLMCGFVLFVLTLIVNLAASAIVNRSRSGAGVEL